MPFRPGHALAWARSASRSNVPDSEWAITPCGAPAARIRRVSWRVSMPEIPISPCDASQPVNGAIARQLDGSVTSARRITPRANGVGDSMSSAFAPTLPMWGKVKVMICPA